jgi:ribosomal protein L37AE/L43A
MSQRTLCPFCGEPLTSRSGTLYCARGRTGLAPRVEQEIVSALQRPTAPNNEVPDTESQGRWLCSRCGARLGLPRVGTIGGRCRGCGFELSNGAAYLLIEHHTHA